MTRKVTLFLILTFLLTWTIEFAAIAWIGDFSAVSQPGSEFTSSAMVLFFIFCMYMPTVSVIIVKKGIYREPLKPLGFSFSLNRWWAISVLIPVLVAVVSIFASTLEPGVTLSSGENYLMEQVAGSSVSQEEKEEAEQLLQALGLSGILLALLLFGTALIAGPTFNAFAAFGEEFGWRGFLQKEWTHIGFWKSSLLIGLIWGVWHFPLIYGGYNYPGEPVLGTIMMTVFTITWSPIHAYVTVMGRSVIPAAITHGTINAIGGITYVFLSGGSNLTSGFIGITGVVLAIITCGFLWLHQNRYRESFTHAWDEFREGNLSETT